MSSSAKSGKKDGFIHDNATPFNRRSGIIVTFLLFYQCSMNKHKWVQVKSYTTYVSSTSITDIEQILYIASHLCYSMGGISFLGEVMAKLIQTGEHEAIDLHIHSDLILMLNNEAKQGRYLKIILSLKKGVYDLAEICETRLLRPKKQSQLPTTI